VPLFRRRAQEPTAEVFLVGVDNHRVVIGGEELGVAMLAELDAYVPLVSARARSGADGRDAVAVQSAKMDYAEMVESTISLLRLALAELVERGSLAEDEVPVPAPATQMDRVMPTYEYIQATYVRASQRIAWVREIHQLLSARGIAVLPAEYESSTRPR
jgi:hypothetical protein